MLRSHPFKLSLGLLLGGIACSALAPDSSEKTNKNDDDVPDREEENPYPWDDSCIAKGTLITTVSGRRPIEKLSVGDLVLSRSETGEFRFNPITHIKSADREVGVIDLPNGASLRTTVNHPVYEATTGEYLRADNLNPST